MRQEPTRPIGDDGPYKMARSLLYFHHRNRKDLESSRNRGCHFCAALLRGLFDDKKDEAGARYSFARGEVILRRDIIDSWIGKENGLEAWNKGD